MSLSAASQDVSTCGPSSERRRVQLRESMEDLEVSFVLQHQLSLQATASIHQASLQRARAMKKTDGGVTVARLVSVSAPRAWAWKSVQPTSRELALTDVQYRIAARLNLGLQPVQAAAMLPDVCVLCADQNRNSIRHDPWHFLSCRALSRRRGQPPPQRRGPRPVPLRAAHGHPSTAGAQGPGRVEPLATRPAAHAAGQADPQRRRCHPPAHGRGGGQRTRTQNKQW